MVKAQILNNSGPEVFHHDIARRRQLPDSLQIIFRTEVDLDALLAGVEMPEIGAFTGPQRFLDPHVFTADRLDLEDLRAAVGKQTGAIRAGNDPGQIKNPDAFERFGCG